MLVLGERAISGAQMERSTDLLRVDVLGVRFAIRWGPSVSEEQQQFIRSAWSRCLGDVAPLLPPVPTEPTESLPFTASAAYISQTEDEAMFALQAASFEALAENLTSRLTVAAILENAGELMMLHACGVASPETGGVVALVAKSGTGKTTAASVLARTFGYVSDETVAIRPDGRVVPYPKPLSVKQGPNAPKRQVGPDELGLHPAPREAFIQSIVLLNRVDPQPRSGEQHLRPEPVLRRLPFADGLLALIPESSSQVEVDEPLRSLCRLIDRVGGIWQVTYSEAADLAQALEPLFRSRPPLKGAWHEPAIDAPTGAVPDGWMRRVTPRDAVAVDGDLLVMLETQIIRLSGIGPAIWDATVRAVPPEQLAEEVGKVHGFPEGYRSAVADGAGQLTAKSVLEQGGK